jgi:hypothetical protein
MCPCGGLLEECICGDQCCPYCGCTTEAIYGPDGDLDDEYDEDDDEYDEDEAAHVPVVTLQPAARYL